MRAIMMVVFLAIIGPALAEPVEVIPPQNKVLSAGSQRYVFGQISDFRRDQYMLDTKTGQLWRIVELECEKKSEPGAKDDECPSILSAVPYRTLDGKYSVTP